MLVSLAVCIGSGGNVWGGAFARLLPWGMVWWVSLGLPLRPFFCALACVFRSLVGTTATVVSKTKTGRIRDWWQSTYSYCIRNYGGFSWFHGRGSGFKGLYWCSLRN